PLSASAITMTDYGKNPDPDVDIAVSVPAGYPGTFEDFKAELTAALIAQGMDASSFRITDTAVKIDTTNLDGWYVYDHYYNQAAYNALGLSAEQQKRQPYRVADNTKMTSHGKSGVSTPCLIQDVFVARRWGTPGNKLYPFNQHTYSWQTNGRANMCFAGYGTNALTDYMFYPATSDSRRTIEFDLDCAVIDTHTLLGAGFLLNTAISSGRLAGYAFYYEWTSATAANAQIRKLQNVDVIFTGSPGTALVSKSVPLPSGTKLRIKVVLERNRVTVTQRTYSGNSMGDEVVLFDNYSIPALPAAGNGFGPVVAYKSHGCASMTYFQYGDLAMTYDATAFDALKEVQYVQSADQKYFVNLSVPGTDDTGIPDPTMDSQGYIDGITRMDQNEIFYVSNKNDGRVGTDNDGIGATNTIYTSTEEDFIQELAQKIANNYNDKKVYSHVNSPDRVIPLSDFYIINSTPDETGKINGSQLMTVHQRHLINTGTSVKVSLRDKSQVGNMPTSGDKLTKYEVRLIDPDGNEVEIYNDGRKTIELTPNADGSVNFPEYTVNANTKPGRYTFSLLVTDNKGNESGWASTYFTVFDDSEQPIAIGENTSKNHATIHLTDTGQGIDEDGITFIQDNRGSGVYAYYITDKETNEDNPTLPGNEDLWIYLDEPVHEYSIDVDLSQYFNAGGKIVVYYMDECRNAGQKAVFKPINVKVQDEDGNDLDDYYIIGETPVIVLPDDVPDSKDPDFEFSNWEIVPPGDTPPGGGDPITSGKEVTVDKEEEKPTIVIKPSYKDTKVNLTYSAVGATIPQSGTHSHVTQIVENADLAAKIKAQNVIPVREGYDFMGWYMDSNCTIPITDQVASTNVTVYAKWQIATYNIIFDHNGGGASGKTKIENVPYGTAINLIANENSVYFVKQNEAPTKPGYIFQYWTTTKNDPNTNVKNSSMKMPAKDLTVYAYYTVDTSKYVVHFDTQGGNRIADKAYASAVTNYGTLQKPVKSGYVFEGWYVKNADGTMSDQKVELSGSNMPSSVARKEHTLMAKWSPATDTPVNVCYYYNSGFKDDKGNYRYVKANNMTKTFRATTDTEVTIPEYIENPDGSREKVLLDGLEGGEYTFSRSYWRNDKVHPEQRTGIVKGGTPLELNLYYDRYFTVTTQVIDGEGYIGFVDEDGNDIITDVLTVKEGERPTIKWKASQSPVKYHVGSVVLDNRIRDGLIGNGVTGEFTFEEDVHKDYVFRVRFDEGEPSSTPVAKDYYTIATSIEGCFDGSCTITPTGRYVAGRDSVEITWDINDDLYRVDSVQIDNTIYFRHDSVKTAYEAKHTKEELKGLTLITDPTFSTNEFTRFRRIAQDHKVIVTVDKVPSIGGNATTGFYTVTVNTYGGDAFVASKVPSSQVLNAGEKFSAG
ncbi:MAG: InlB B-repeat-containing protein, partial [Eubacterium sp.]|nr:InlB B-repeat-containing protein [Eubacterium sp.]